MQIQDHVSTMLAMRAISVLLRMIPSNNSMLHMYLSISITKGNYSKRCRSGVAYLRRTVRCA